MQKATRATFPKPSATPTTTKVPASLDTIHAQTDVPIRIFNREGKELYDSRHDARSPGSVLEESRKARLNDARITRELSQGWREQRYWHETLPDTITANPEVMPATAQHLLVEHSELQVLEGVQRDAARATSLITRCASTPLSLNLQRPRHRRYGL